MALLESGDEFDDIRGDRPPDGHIGDFAAWDPTNQYGFRADDSRFPAPPLEEAMRRQDETADFIAEIIEEHVAYTLDTKEPLEDVVYKSTRRLPLSSGVKPEEIISESITNVHAEVTEAFDVWLSGSFPKAKNLDEVISMMNGTFVEAEEPPAQIWPPKGATLVSDLDKKSLVSYEQEFEE